MADAKLYSTQNLYEAAFCLCQGLRLAGKKADGRKVQILFEGENAKEQALKFYNGATVEAKALMDAYRTLKDFVFER